MQRKCMDLPGFFQSRWITPITLRNNNLEKLDFQLLRAFFEDMHEPKVV